MNARPPDDLTGWTETLGTRRRFLTRATADGALVSARQGADGLWRVSSPTSGVGIGPGRATLTAAVEAAGLDLEVMA